MTTEPSAPPTRPSCTETIDRTAPDAVAGTGTTPDAVAGTGHDVDLRQPARTRQPDLPDRRAALAPGALLIVAVLLVAANLRPAVTSLGAVLDEVRGSLHVSSALVSVLTALPCVCFGAAGFLAPWLARRYGLARAIGLALALLTGGVLARVLDGPGVVLSGTLVACAGIAVCNVLIPVVVTESYPHRIGLLTGLYTACLQGAAALGSVLTPRVDAALGGWRPALGQWGLLAAVGLLGWTVAARHDRTPHPAAARPVGRHRSLARSRLAWLVTAFFGLQSMFAYEMMGWAPQVLMGAGIPRATAGAMMGVISVLGVPMSLVVGPIAARQRSQSAWLVGLTACSIVGVAGLLLAPAAAPWLWSACLGVGMGVFAVALALLSLRTTNAADTRSLSTMAQGNGYLLAASGPRLFGMLHGVTGGWAASLLLTLGGLVAQLCVGLFVGRDRHV